MATKSILKNVEIRDRNAALAFVGALENAERKRVQRIKKHGPFSDASRSDIHKMFGKIK